MWLNSSEKIHAPEVGRPWINSPGLTLSQLRGRVALVDFWDYTCVNCIRTLPYVSEWDRRYRNLGLTVIGVHTPEFHFARASEYVERAARDFGLEYPIVLDNEREIWEAYSNRCWPAKYLVDKDGYVRFYHFGEGGYRETEEAIQKLLREVHADVNLPELMVPVRDSDKQGARCLPVTPELYLGFSRGRLGNESGYAENKVKDYQAGSNFIPAHAYLDGPWFAGSESIEACPLNDRLSRLAVSYNASEVNLVLSPPPDREGILAIMLDGRPLTAPEAGESVVWVEGRPIVKVGDPGMYRLIRSKKVESGLIEISTSTPGIEAYAFTFVSCAS